MAVQLPSSFSSNIGNSMTHSGAQSLVYSLRSAPSFTRSAPIESLTIFALSAPKKTRSPFCAPVRSITAASAASDRFLTMGDCRPASFNCVTSLTLM